MNKELLEEIKRLLKSLHITGLEDIDLLLKLTSEDIKRQTDLSYQVTPILKKLIEYANIYRYLDDEEETELLKYNQTDFFSKVMGVGKLAENILNELFLLDMIHPILDADIEFEDTIDSWEDSMEILSEIQNELDQKSLVNQKLKLYHKRTTELCYQNFIKIVIQNLKITMLENNYEQALNYLSDYIKEKMKIMSGISNDYLLMTDIDIMLHNMLNPRSVDYIMDEIEYETLDEDELDDEDYLNFLILKFENRYLRQKACHYHYRQKEKEVTYYLEKCKKM